MIKKRVVITGMGAITPIGNDVNSTWESIQAEKIGINRITYFDTSDYKVKLAAEVKNFSCTPFLKPKEFRRMDIVSQYGVVAAIEAIRMSELAIDEIDPYRAGVIVGTASGGINTLESEYLKLLDRGNGAISAFAMPKYMANSVPAQIAIKFGFKGKCMNISDACATGVHSIGEAYRCIQYDECNIMLAGGAEACITPITIAGFQSLTALSTAKDPKRGSIPFDKERNGFVLGEGAGILVLEELEHALERKANILAEIVGYGVSCDAEHIIASNVEGPARAIRNALKDAGIKPQQIDVINAHGTSTQSNDWMENQVIKEVFDENAYKIPVQATKSMTGHLIGASGAIESIVCTKQILEGYIHSNVGLNDLEEDYNLNYIKEPIENIDIKYILNNSFAFGGQKGSLILKKYDKRES